MKRTRKITLLLALVLLVSTFLGACASNTAPAATDNAVGSEASAATDQAGEVTLEFFQSKTESSAAWDSVIQKFEEANPGIMIEQVNLPDAMTVLTTRIANNDTPDIFNHYPLRTDFNEIVKSGAIMPITGSEFLSNVNQDVLEWSVKDDGEIYALPFTLNTMGIYFNNTVLEKYGIEIPDTYEGLISLLEQVKDQPDGKFLFACNDGSTLWQMFDRRLGQLFANSGASFTDTFESIAVGSISSKDSPEIVSAIEKMIELYQYAQDDPFGANVAQACNDFANGNGIAIFGGTWYYPSIIAANPDMDFSFVPFPADEGQTSYMSVNVDIGLSISATCEHPQEALKFLEFVSQPENAQIFVDLDGSLSLVQGVKNNVAEFSAAYDVINSGDAYKMASTQWPVGYNSGLVDIIGALMLDNDFDTFYSAVDTLTETIYNQ